MEITKIRGKEEVRIVVRSIDAQIAKRLNMPLEEFVKTAVDETAKKRRWNWRKSSIETKE